jgi:hypothetical protein
VDAPHTYFQVQLGDARGESVVTYKTQGSGRRGAWAIFHANNVPLKVETLDGRALAPVYRQTNTSCTLLSGLSVFELGDDRVRIVFGPASVARTTLVFEFMQDFVIDNGRDTDGDGYGTASDVVTSFCAPPAGYVQNADDCDDTKPQVHPGAQELCDGIDQNCNGAPDDVGLPCSVGRGACLRDGTTECTANGSAARCNALAGPATLETCDGKDSNCDGVEDLASPGLCAAAEAPRCMVDRGTVRCGCLEDNDCGDARSGRICDLDSLRCVDGCVNLPGRNGCSGDARCTSSDPSQPGTCQAECTPGCPPGLSCKDGACVKASSDAPDAGPDVPLPAASRPSDATGCGCGTHGDAPSAGILVLLACLTLRAGRRQLRRRP